MNQIPLPLEQVPTVPGTPWEGGFFYAIIRENGRLFALVVSPKSEGELKGKWHTDYVDVPGANSFTDGLANTDAMARAGSALAQEVRALNIAGFSDWYIPARDELEPLYRNLKPTTEENACYYRDGENASLHFFDEKALTPYPLTALAYTPEFPAQTTVPGFQEGGAQALSDDWHWSSTQPRANSYYAYYQHFSNGGQDGNGKDGSGRVRAVRRLAIQ